jgi:hypothetical protein
MRIKIIGTSIVILAFQRFADLASIMTTDDVATVGEDVHRLLSEL